MHLVKRVISEIRSESVGPSWEVRTLEIPLKYAHYFTPSEDSDYTEFGA